MSKGDNTTLTTTTTADDHNSDHQGSPKSSTLIIAGYTCIGKTTFTNKKELWRDLGVSEVVDLDSSTYSREPDFPHNYLKAIRQKADEDGVRVVLVATFPGVATKLKEEGYYVAQIYPQKDSKEQWLQRLEAREKEGKESRLYKLVEKNWDIWFDDMGRRDVSKSVTVCSEDYLSTVIGEICRAFMESRKDPRPTREEI
ncbi:hypothetical protein M406DRAFT_74249 [Cryphonectria parasitica EP155]|uniref:Uncharacterized protein n=1 Tax=Cryphonectria parasitica (strain ATCC 38755 / EP155) TaxID=660469 RepID=A0A9P4XZD1_CRYP1|nr:uncharacterized protein M406DRAFT_74249 [Cryphonectria parasitica EP155]KAF3763673.1 hypothetical protein M406DRAFT_74249 [Cryphonectria parasitica EP155]